MNIETSGLQGLTTPLLSVQQNNTVHCFQPLSFQVLKKEKMYFNISLCNR